MSFLTSLDISASGMAAQRTRVDLAASNLANAESTRGPDGGPYKRRDAVLGAVGSFDDAVAQAQGQVAGAKVAVVQVVEDQGPGRPVYLPGHPDADAQGFVTFPDVNPVHETVNLITAQRSYEANATAVETLKTMAQRALDIAR